MRMRFSLTVCVLSLLATTIGAAQSAGVDRFFNEFSEEWVRANPNLAVFSRYFSGDEQDRLDRQLTPWTREWEEGEAALAEEGLEQLKKFDRRTMSRSQRVSAALMEWNLRATADYKRYRDYEFPLQQFGGANVALVSALTVSQPVRSVRDAENYVARLRQVSVRMKEATTEAERLANSGMLPPAFIVGATIRQMEQFIAPSPAENPLVSTLARKALDAKLPENRTGELRAEAMRITEADVYPAWRSAIALLNSIRSRTTDDAGLWRLKGGDEAYRYFLRVYTTTDLSPDQIHEIGLREVKRIESEMETILSRLDRTSGSLADRIAALKKELAYPETSEGRAQIMQDISGIMRDAEARSALLFDRRPKASVVAEAYPEFQQATAAPSYASPPTDGSRPGIFRMPLRREWLTRYMLRSVVYHETIPGHHFQLAQEVEDESQPKFRRARIFGSTAAFSEGWGLYAERLATEAGWYSDDAVGRLGQLESELIRAKRLVVDTGLHAKRWTRQQAIDYGLEAAEIERYVVRPGQACAYMIGQLKILELREKARKALGAQFTDRGFHNTVLSTGSVPLAVLEQEVDFYIHDAGR